MTKVSCPECGRPVPWSAELSPWRPFCSDRCRLLDLGAWVSGDRAIPGEEPASGAAPERGEEES